MEITNVAVELLKPSNHQAAERVKDVASLAESIKAIGILNAITVRDSGKGSLEIIAGHRRFAAAKLAGLKEIPCVVLPVDADQAQIIRITENVHRVNLTPLQEAANIQALLDRKWDFPKIAAELGMTAQYLARRAKLLDLSPEWNKALIDPKNSGGYQDWSVQLLELVARYPHSRQNQLLKEFNYGAPDIEELRGSIAEGEHELKLAPWDMNDENLLPKAGYCNSCPKRSGCQPLLFEELAEDKKVQSGDRCLDSECWEKKRQAHVARAKAKILKEHPKVVSVSTEKDSWALRSHHHTGVLARGTFKVVKEGEKGALPAIPIDGPKAGDLIWITKNKEGVITRTSSPKKSAADKKPISNAERKQRLLNRRNMFIVQHLIEHIDNSKTQPLGLMKLNADDQIRQALCGTLAIGYQFVSGHGGGGWDSYERLLKQNVPDVVSTWWKEFRKEIRRSIMSYNGEDATRHMKYARPLVDMLGLDWDELQKKAAEEIPDRHGLLSGKKPEPAKKSKMATKQKPVREKKHGK